MKSALVRDLRTVVISLLVASVVFAAPSVAATIAANSHAVDGKHAVSATTNRSTRAGKLVATTASGYLPNNIIAKADDANKLDGKDSTAFLAATGKAADANLLDGKDLTEILSQTKGDKGEKGDTGPRGPAGEIGATGPLGLPGEKGATGERGPIGEKGLAGPAGEKGPIGPQGIAGPAGEKGFQGEKGTTGAAGAAGERGPAGPAGERGPIGPQGIAGPAGEKGAAGLQGPVGPQGPSGFTSVTAVPIAAGTTITTTGVILATVTLSRSSNYLVSGGVTALSDLSGSLQCQLVRQSSATWDDMGQIDVSARTTVGLEHIYPRASGSGLTYNVSFGCISDRNYVTEVGHLYVTQVDSISQPGTGPVISSVPKSLAKQSLR